MPIGRSMGGQDQGKKTEMREVLEYKKDKAIEKKRMHTFLERNLFIWRHIEETTGKGEGGET